MSGRDRILVVDDDPGMRRALQRILSPWYEVETAAGATSALARLRIPAVPPAAAGHVSAAGAAGGTPAVGAGTGGTAASSAMPAHLEGNDGGGGGIALALVDVRLMEGDGYSLCQAIREGRPETDVILITGSLSQPDEKLYRSLEQGAFYFLFKPFDRRVLLALVERCLRLQRERADKERFGQVLAADLERARRFQRSLLPRQAVAAGGWRLEGRLLSCDALGGDMFQAHASADGVVWAVTDVVGHGVAAAMYAGMLRSTLDAARRRSPEPRDMIGELLAGIDFFEAAKYATMVYGLLRPDGTLRYVNAGHPAPLWLHGSTASPGTQGGAAAQGADGVAAGAGGTAGDRQAGALSAAVQPLPATGFFLSTAFRDRPHMPAEIVMLPGDRLLVYTDGASEACGPAGQELGAAALAQALEECRALPLTDALDALLERIRDHCGGSPIDDDVTLLLIERTAASAAAQKGTG
jgi:phosphoserine phosphatase RsbU/P